MALSKSADVVTYVLLVIISLALIGGIVATIKKTTETAGKQTTKENYKSTAIRIATQIQEADVFGKNTEVEEGMVAYFRLKIPDTINGKQYMIKAEENKIVVENQEAHIYGIKAQGHAQSNDAWVYFYKPNIAVIGDSSQRK
ncbi:MAG: hypothetical protein QW331_01380 [Candidatus Woesearchaeota archaeon]